MLRMFALKPQMSRLASMLLLSPGPPEQSHAIHLSMQLWCHLINDVANGPSATSCEIKEGSFLGRLLTWQRRLHPHTSKKDQKRRAILNDERLDKLTFDVHTVKCE